jgi:hypothetical protein
MNNEDLTGTRTGIGTIVAGAAARAAVGTVPVPVGTVVGGVAGKGIAEAIDPTVELAYWSENFRERDYVEKGSSFDDYGPAYGFGVDVRAQNPGRDFDDLESNLSRTWPARRGSSSLSWDRAKHAARDAWNRIGRSS